MDTSSRTKSVERPVRAADLFIASLDALTLLEGSSTLSARIDSDERATLLASFGWPVCRTKERQRDKEKERKNGEKREATSIEQTRKRKGSLNERVRERGPSEEKKKQKKSREVRSPDSSNILHGPNESLWDRKKSHGKIIEKNCQTTRASR